jgi:hypothetical protein
MLTVAIKVVAVTLQQRLEKWTANIHSGRGDIQALLIIRPFTIGFNFSHTPRTQSTTISRREHRNSKHRDEHINSGTVRSNVLWYALKAFSATANTWRYLTRSKLQNLSRGAFQARYIIKIIYHIYNNIQYVIHYIVYIHCDIRAQSQNCGARRVGRCQAMAL